MNHRIRFALHNGSIEMVKGECEADETFIGVKAPNVHIDVKKRCITGSRLTDKTAAMGILQRGDKNKGTHSKVKISMIPDRKKKIIHAEVKAM